MPICARVMGKHMHAVFFCSFLFCDASQAVTSRAAACAATNRLTAAVDGNTVGIVGAAWATAFHTLWLRLWTVHVSPVLRGVLVSLPAHLIDIPEEAVAAAAAAAGPADGHPLVLPGILIKLPVGTLSFCYFFLDMTHLLAY